MQAAIDIKVLQTLGMARDRPSPYVERGRFSTSPQHGEGQALALRGRGAVFRRRNPLVTVARGPVPRDRYRQEWRFRSFRTYMSIATRVGPFSGFFAGARTIDIQVLQT